MPFVRYSVAQKAEAVALAAVLGLSATADQLGIPEDTIASWMAKAGRRPADAIEAPSWKRVADLALTKAERMVAEGKLSVAQLLNVVAMSQKGAATEAKASPDEASATRARDQFYDWLTDRVATDGDDVEALAAAMRALQPALLVIANDEPGRPHRSAMLAWFSDRAEVPAGDVLAWAQATTDALIAEHGSLLEWHRDRLADEERKRVVRQRAEWLVREAGIPSHVAIATAEAIA
jgi:hypothetical protein